LACYIGYESTYWLDEGSIVKLDFIPMTMVLCNKYVSSHNLDYIVLKTHLGI
jgi:hypothetical protein